MMKSALLFLKVEPFNLAETSGEETKNKGEYTSKDESRKCFRLPSELWVKNTMRRSIGNWWSSRRSCWSSFVRDEMVVFILVGIKITKKGRKWYR